MLAEPIRFLAYAMTYAHHEDKREIRQLISDKDFREALDHAPPGIIDPRSWAHWNSKMGRYPPPPSPVRRFAISAATQERVPKQRSQRGSPAPAQELTTEERRAEARAYWQKIRQQQPSPADPEEVRRDARENWLAKYGSAKKS